MNAGRPVGSVTGGLTRLGFADPPRALRMLADPALTALIDSRTEIEDDGLARALATVADPDQALLGLVRFMEVVATPAGPNAGEVTAALRSDSRFRSRLLEVLGSSAALTDHLVAHPDQWLAVRDAAAMTVQERIAALVADVRDSGDLPAQDALRIGYRRQLLGIAALDVTADDPTATLPETAAALADAAEAALEAALVIARDTVGEAAEQCRFAVIGMGKTGGRELNYISDVDVIFVAEPADGVDESDAMAVGTELASLLMRILFGPHSGRLALAGRPGAAPGRKARAACAHRGQSPRLLRTVGQDVGVPGSAQGTRRRGGP